MSRIEFHDDGAERNRWFGKIAICVRINETNSASNLVRHWPYVDSDPSPFPGSEPSSLLAVLSENS